MVGNPAMTGTNPSSGAATLHELSQRRRLYRATTAVELLFAPLALLALVHTALLEMSDLMLGLAGFLWLVLGLVYAHELWQRPDHAPPSRHRASRGTLLLGGGIVVSAWIRLPHPPFEVWLLLLTTPLLAVLQYAIRPAAKGGPREFSVAAAARTRTIPAAPKVARGRFDWLLGIWLLNLVFGTFLGWVLTSAVELTEENWRPWVGARAALCVLLPLVCVLPGFRHLRRPHLAARLVVLVAITGFQVATGWNAAVDYVSGPVWQEVVVVRRFTLERRVRGTRVEGQRVELADGRVLVLPDRLQLDLGPSRLLLLAGLERILRVAPP